MGITARPGDYELPPWKKPNDTWMCMSHDDIAPFPCVLVLEDMRKLIEAAGTWDAICAGVQSGKFKKKVLTAMREIMGVQPFEEWLPELPPKQDWIALKIVEFATWYLANHGNPPKEWDKYEKTEPKKETAAT